MRSRLYNSGIKLLEEIKTTSLPEDFISIWYLGQSGMLIKFMDTALLIDPHLEDSLAKRAEKPCIRNYPSPLDPSWLDFVDYVLITHNHADHLEPATIIKIEAGNQKVNYIIPYPEKDALLKLGIPPEKIIGAKPGQTTALRDITFIPIPAAHYEIKRDQDGNAFALGYVINLGKITIYHSGDTVVYPEMPELLKKFTIDVAMLPINGRDWIRDSQGIIGNTNFKEAADLGDAIGADMLIPIHFDLYDHNTENPGYLADYLYRQYPGLKYHIFQPGERMVYLKSFKPEESL
jgi:L-ascorbate 6-phosphate lactonase